MKTTSRAIKELELMYQACKTHMESRISYYFNNTPDDPIITISTSWRRKLPFDVEFRTWESKATQAMTVMAGQAQNQAKHYNEIRLNAAILSKPVPEMMQVMYSASAYYWMKSRSYNKSSNYITQSDESFLFSAGINYDDTKAPEERFLPSQKVIDAFTSKYVIQDKNAFDLYTNTPVKSNTVGSPLKKWGCPSCGVSVRVSRKQVHIKCDDCGKNYEYVDKDRVDYYSETYHKFDPSYAALPGTAQNCLKCNRNQSFWAHNRTNAWL